MSILFGRARTSARLPNVVACGACVGDVSTTVGRPDGLHWDLPWLPLSIALHWRIVPIIPNAVVKIVFPRATSMPIMRGHVRLGRVGACQT